jgi:hypothetical protein
MQQGILKEENETNKMELVKEELERNDMRQDGEKRQRETIRKVRVKEITSK